MQNTCNSENFRPPLPNDRGRSRGSDDGLPEEEKVLVGKTAFSPISGFCLTCSVQVCNSILRAVTQLCAPPSSSSPFVPLPIAHPIPFVPLVHTVSTTFSWCLLKCTHSSPALFVPLPYPTLRHFNNDIFLGVMLFGGTCSMRL